MMRTEAQPLGWFVVRAGGACPPGRYALDGAGRWSGPCPSTVELLDALFRADRHDDAVSAAAEQFGGRVERHPEALSA